MLHEVPTALSKMARHVVMNHPNAFNCRVFRKIITRPNPKTMGGLAVLDNGDEEEFEYVQLGYGYAMRTDAFQGGAMVKIGDANIENAEEFRFLIEPEEPSGHPEHFDIRTHDVMFLILGEEPKAVYLAFEIVGVEAVVNIPPFHVRYVANRRDDLHNAILLNAP